eukprot:909094-Pelagomonas_calceolata.AAC.3
MSSKWRNTKRAVLLFVRLCSSSVLSLLVRPAYIHPWKAGWHSVHSTVAMPSLPEQAVCPPCQPFLHKGA